MKTISQAIKTITTVLTAVARFELTPSIPIFAKIEVHAAKIADKIADRNGDRYIPPLGKKVMKPGRLYFHTAPHSSCKMPSTFLLSKEIM